MVLLIARSPIDKPPPPRPAIRSILGDKSQVFRCVRATPCGTSGTRLSLPLSRPWFYNDGNWRREGKGTCAGQATLPFCCLCRLQTQAHACTPRHTPTPVAATCHAICPCSQLRQSFGHLFLFAVITIHITFSVFHVRVPTRQNVWAYFIFSRMGQSSLARTLHISP